MQLGVVVRGFVGACSLTLAAAGCAAVYEPADGVPDVGDDPRALPDGAEARVAECPVDQMRERLCGSLAEPVDRAADAPFWDCPAEPKQLTSAGPTMLFYTSLKKLEFDRHMTLQYRDELRANCGDDGEHKGECCFSRCTPLPVAAESTRAVPDGAIEHVRCVDAPQSGTTAPAPGFEECPNALVFGLGPTPFEADPFDAAATERLRAREAEFFASTPRCCYRTLD